MGVVFFVLVVLNLVLERSWICLNCCNCMAESEDKIYTRCSAVYCRHFQWQLMWAPTQSLFSTILSTLDCVRSVQLARCFIFAIFKLLLHPPGFIGCQTLWLTTHWLGKLLVIFFPQEYDELLHEFMSAVKQAYGEKVLVQVSADTTSSHWNPHLWLCVLEGFNVVIQSSVVYCVECCDQLVPLCGIDANFCSLIFTVNLVATDWFSVEMNKMVLEYMHPSM
jgi:hypothetical protein